MGTGHYHVISTLICRDIIEGTAFHMTKLYLGRNETRSCNLSTIHNLSSIVQ